MSALLVGLVGCGVGRPVSAEMNPYVARLSSGGAFQWVYVERRRGEGLGVAVDRRGDVYLSGSTTPTDGPDGEDVPLVPLVRKVSARGKAVWRDSLPGASPALALRSAHEARA